MKKYGAEKTHLTLTGKALDAYSETDPLQILEEEIETETGETEYIYSARGAIEADDMSERELIVMLEELYDAAHGVTNSEGHLFRPEQWETIAAHMDDEIREALNAELAPCTTQEFFDAYAAAHLDKYGEKWELDKANPTW